MNDSSDDDESLPGLTSGSEVSMGGTSLRGDSDDESEGSCAGALEFFDTEDFPEETPYVDAAEYEHTSGREEVQPDSRVPADLLPLESPDAPLRLWRRQWHELLDFVDKPKLPFHEVPQLLMKLSASLPAQFAGFWAQLAGARGPGTADAAVASLAISDRETWFLCPLQSFPWRKC